VPRDIATREIFDVCVEQKLGVNGENMVYLDLSHKDPKELDVKLGGIIEIYEKFMGDDPRKIPMKIFPAVHYSMGGMWVDYNQMTNIPGLFACGECEYQYHGANRLGANSLLSAIYGGMVTGPKAIEYIRGLKKSAEDVSETVFERERNKQAGKYESILKMDGNENAYVLHKELGEWMTNNMTVVRYNNKLQETINKIKELKQRYKNININDTARWNNTGVAFTRQLWNMMELAEAMTVGALLRNESRGAHYKPEFLERDDEKFMKTTKAKWTAEGPEITYEDIDVSLIAPRKRDYSTDKKKEG
jgi:succinate dehydrogenase / fumarate reductase flavoprotein subunit